MDTLLQILRALEPFDNSSTVRRLRIELKKKLAILESKRSEEEAAISVREPQPNVSRAAKLKKYHHYIRLIHDNYPEIPYPDIRRLFKSRKQGNEVSIPDVVWQNPSP